MRIAILLLAGIGCRSDVKEKLALARDRERMHRVIARDRHPGDDGFSLPFRGSLTWHEFITHDLFFDPGKDIAVIDPEAGPAVAAARNGFTESLDRVGATIAIAVFQGDQKAARGNR